jgi:hypothetical protein
MQIIRAVSGLALIAASACAPAATTSVSPVRRSAALPATVLTQRELSRYEGASDLYSAIRTLNPNLLFHRGSVVSVALDGVLVGTTEYLRSLPSSSVREVRLIEGPDATMLFGTRHTGAVLLVSTRTR